MTKKLNIMTRKQLSRPPLHLILNFTEEKYGKEMNKKWVCVDDEIEFLNNLLDYFIFKIRVKDTNNEVFKKFQSNIRNRLIELKSGGAE